MIILALAVLFLLARGMGIFDKVFYFPEGIERAPEEEKEDTAQCIDVTEEHRTASRVISRELETIEVQPVGEGYEKITYIAL
jgi:hypothetical protein